MIASSVRVGTAALSRGRRFVASATIAAAALVFIVPPAAARPGPEGFSDLAEKVRPAVVNIATEQRVAAGPRGPGEFQIPPGLRGSPFEEFLRRFMQPPGQGEGPSEPGPGPRASALGSGFIIDSSGYVVTNSHVVREAGKVTVTLHDGSKLDARVVGRDDKTDVALVKVETERPLPFVTWGDSDATKVGDWVLAVGNPFGLGGTVTAGIVSARGRDIQSGPFDDYLQIDAPINRGNSGGPSFNMAGEVIGINTAIYSPNGGSIGIGFAIPATMVRTVLQAALSGGKLRRPWLGAEGQDVTSDIAGSVGLARIGGVIIKDVYPGGPAARAGLRQGDVVVAVNGRDIVDGEDLRFRIATLPIGSTADLAVLRGRKELTLPLELAPAPEDPPRHQTKLEGAVPLAGATVANLSPALAEEIGTVRVSHKGVVIVAVERRSIAERLRLEPGDIVVGINGDSVGSVAELKQLLKQKPPVWQLQINRAGQLINLNVRA